MIRRSLPTDPSDRGSMSPFFAEVERQGMKPEREMLYVGLEPATESIAQCLQVETGTEVIARRKKLLADGKPARIATSYLDAARFTDTQLGDGEFIMPSLQSAIDALGYEFESASETLIARNATDLELDLLELKQGSCVVEIVRTSYAVGGVPIHVLETICDAANHLFDIKQPEGRDRF